MSVQLHSTFKGVEALKDPNLREGRLPLILINPLVFNFAMDVIEELCFIIEWMQKIKFCA